jgi:hypothetical protein
MNMDTDLTDLTNFATQYTPGPGYHFDQIASLDPGTFWHSFVFLFGIILLNDLLRTALITELVRSVFNHLVLCALTLLPGFLLGGVLVYAAYRHPERAWINLFWAAVLYLPWWLGGELTKLSRSDVEGPDVGWIFHGALITFPVGVAAALIFH